MKHFEEAEKTLAAAETIAIDGEESQALVQIAQAHALLAIAARLEGIESWLDEISEKMPNA